MQSYKDLKVWQEAMELTVELYDWLKDFPENEKICIDKPIEKINYISAF